MHQHVGELLVVLDEVLQFDDVLVVYTFFREGLRLEVEDRDQRLVLLERLSDDAQLLRYLVSLVLVALLDVVLGLDSILQGIDLLCYVFQVLLRGFDQHTCVDLLDREHHGRGLLRWNYIYWH